LSSFSLGDAEMPRSARSIVDRRAGAVFTVVAPANNDDRAMVPFLPAPPWFMGISIVAFRSRS
jgi:hypothetical protein